MGQCVEQIVYIQVLLCARLHVLYPVPRSQLLALLFGDLPLLGRAVYFVPHYYLAYVLRVVLVYLLQPILYVVKGFPIRYRVHLHNNLCTRTMPAEPLQQVYVMVLNLYCPAVSHICILILVPSTFRVLILKSTPIVVMWVILYSQFTNLRRMLVFPTAESPIITTLTRKSYLSSSFFPAFFAIQNRKRQQITIPSGFLQQQLMRIHILFVVLALGACTDWSGVDSIIQQAINYRAFPGGVLAVGNINQVLYTKAYGTLTYNQDVYQEPVLTTTKYDIASVTKVLGTTAAIMQLVQDGKLKLADFVSKYISQYDTSLKRNTTISNLLTHSAGLLYDYPGPLPSTVQEVYDYIYYCRPEYPVGTKFSYSNLGFVVLAKIVEIVTNRTIMDYYHQSEVVMDLHETGFNPKLSEVYNIAPTEYDTEIRHEVVRGEAHERLAYFLGGAAGHSGYFSTAADLLTFVRILSAYGKLPNKPRVYTEEIVKTFTTRVPANYTSTMGYGFDTACPGDLMKDCFGHHGSTGCSAWTDRATNISFGLVTNRGHPNVNNNLFWDYIPKIANEIMKALGHSE